MLQNSFYAISGTFYTLLNNTDLYLSYFILSYVFLEHNDSVEWGLTVLDGNNNFINCLQGWFVAGEEEVANPCYFCHQRKTGDFGCWAGTNSTIDIVDLISMWSNICFEKTWTKRCSS